LWIARQRPQASLACQVSPAGPLALSIGARVPIGSYGPVGHGKERVEESAARAREKPQGRERMKRHRIAIILTVPLLLGGLLMPTGASAGTMLSGYGGPGAGDQAILGSTLVGGSGASGGGGAGSSGSSGSASTSSGVAAGGATANTAAPSGGASAGKPAKGSHHGSRGNSSTRHTSAGATPAYSVSTGSRPQAAVNVSSGFEPLGLSGSDLVLVLIVAGGLVLTGGFTRRLARTPS
jgi:hypothetical protein